MNAPILRSYEFMTARPLFTDVLSGDIVPPTDPVLRVHNLARLSVATFMRGLENPRRDDDDIASYVYMPSWAPGVEATVFCEVDPDNGRQNMVSLSLVAEHTGLDIDETIRVSGIQEVTVIEDREGGDETTYNINLGESLYVARLAVTGAAQHFFTNYNNQ